MRDRLRVELAVQDTAGALTARDCGADRVELCTALALGGLTPSTSLVRAAVGTGIPVHVLVRPRAGGFVHDAAEGELLLAEVREAASAGAAGVVVGALDPAGPCGLDVPLLRAARTAADGLRLTFHRAADVLLAAGTPARDLVEALHALGVDRLLTSGGAARAVEGRDVVAELVDASAGRLEVVAGSGVLAGDVALLAATGVDALHASAQRTVHDGTEGPLGRLGADAARFQGRPRTDPELASELVRAVREVSP